MSADRLHRLFRSFSQVDASTTNTVEQLARLCKEVECIARSKSLNGAKILQKELASEINQCLATSVTNELQWTRFGELNFIIVL
jgi:hypothetical protein